MRGSSKGDDMFGISSVHNRERFRVCSARPPVRFGNHMHELTGAPKNRNAFPIISSSDELPLYCHEKVFYVSFLCEKLDKVKNHEVYK